ncbi:hypothetical protein C5C41_07720 [Rathayibacter sp. AY1E9]|nr:hypothetical protein C5C41_07720 [Rathayibacter sp. AY1E9]PPG58972.1 hypothetical protein C5C57_08485 [Rathayibacter sp. AY1C5]
MDLLYTRRFHGFCIVSSDGDFTRLASRIREEGVTVYRFGERKTPEAFRNACDQFTYLDVLGATVTEAAPPAPTRTPPAKLRSDTKQHGRPHEADTIDECAAERPAEEDGAVDAAAAVPTSTGPPPALSTRNGTANRVTTLPVLERMCPTRRAARGREERSAALIAAGGRPGRGRTPLPTRRRSCGRR